MLMTSVLEQNVFVGSNFYFKLSKNKYSSELINFKIVVAQSIGVLPLTVGALLSDRVNSMVNPCFIYLFY